jgi:tRNA-2-methylthio-N6-dimethylallyladenosine synthase
VSRKLYIRTFGCQMNEYDSDKMADVLHAADGLELTASPGRRRQPVQHLFGTGKAQECVFHDLGRVREPAIANPAHHRCRRLRSQPGKWR